MPLTGTGVVSRQSTSPPATTTHVGPLPVPIAVAPATPLAGTAVVLHANPLRPPGPKRSGNSIPNAHSSGPLTVPSPSPPFTFSPQHLTLPTESNSQVCCELASIAPARPPGSAPPVPSPPVAPVAPVGPVARVAPRDPVAPVAPVAPT